MKLQNQDIWFGYIKLLELSKVDLPVGISAKISRIINDLKEPYRELETKRIELIKKYGEKDKKKQQLTVDPLSDNAIKLAVEFGEILLQYQEIQIEKAFLPRGVSSICGKCHENIEVSFLISPDILIPLLGKFVEIE